MVNNTFNLEILSPEGEIFKDDVTEVILPTMQGQIAVLANHAPLFTKLKEGEIVIKKKDKDIFIAVTGGFVEINNNAVSILADYAVKSEEVEAKRAEAAKKKAEELLKEKEKQSKVDFVTAEKDLRRAILELQIAEKVKKRYRPSS